MKKIKVAINGFGRIGRAFFRLSQRNEYIEVVAINDLGSLESLAYSLKYDTVYGKADFSVSHKEGFLIVEGKDIPVFAEKDPLKLPWKNLTVDVVVESTGAFTSYDKAKVHLEAGAKRVVISAPAKGESSDSNVIGATILMGSNQNELATCQISSNASCTTNAGNPLMAILDETVGVEKALLNTIHAYTATQALVDGPSKKDLREGRAAAQNIIPSSTGAAIATTLVQKQLAGKFDGVSVRVPVPVGSLVDITFLAKRDTTVQEINEILTNAAKEKRWEGIFTVVHDEIVSSDIIGDTHASIADLGFTKVVGGNLVKVFAWYDNEIGYTNTLVMHVLEIGKYL